MRYEEYKEKAMRTKNNELSKRDLLIESVMGLTGEAGEVADIVKKYLYQGHNLDKEHIKEEVGDVMWYIVELLESVDLELEDCLQYNIDKLNSRYEGGFSKDKSVNRLV